MPTTSASGQIRSVPASRMSPLSAVNGFPKDGRRTVISPLRPDLAVEVLSPNDLIYDVDEKIREYLDAGVKLIWIINPEQQTVTVYRADGSAARLTETDTLDGQQVVPGFSCLVGEFFQSVELSLLNVCRRSLRERQLFAAAHSKAIDSLRYP